jgi:hypothetical protein
MIIGIFYLAKPGDDERWEPTSLRGHHIKAPSVVLLDHRGRCHHEWLVRPAQPALP